MHLTMSGLQAAMPRLDRLPRITSMAFPRRLPTFSCSRVGPCLSPSRMTETDSARVRTKMSISTGNCLTSRAPARQYCHKLTIISYNMHAASGNILSTAELIKKKLSGESIPEPPFHRLPLYEAGAYKQFVQDSMQIATSSDYSSPQRIEVNIATGKNTSDYNFGQTRGGASVGVSTGWFSFSASASHSEESSTCKLAQSRPKFRLRSLITT